MYLTVVETLIIVILLLYFNNKSNLALVEISSLLFHAIRDE